MTAHQPMVIDSHEPRAKHPLRAWRERQMVWDEQRTCRRRMRLKDVTRLYGIPFNSWFNWELFPGEPGFRRPEEENMKQLFLITKGEITPDLYYPVKAWAAELDAEAI